MNKGLGLSLAAAVVITMGWSSRAQADVMSGPCEMATAGDMCTTLMNEDGTCQLVDNVLTCVPTSTTGSGGAGGSGSGGATTTSGNGGSSTSSGGDSEDEGGCSVAALGHAGGGEPAWLLFALAGLGLAWRKRGA